MRSAIFLKGCWFKADWLQNNIVDHNVKWHHKKKNNVCNFSIPQFLVQGSLHGGINHDQLTMTLNQGYLRWQCVCIIEIWVLCHDMGGRHNDMGGRHNMTCCMELQANQTTVLPKHIDDRYRHIWLLYIYILHIFGY